MAPIRTQSGGEARRSLGRGHPTFPAGLAVPLHPRRVDIDCYGVTHRGRVRPQNEDQFLIAELHRGIRVEQTSLPGHEGVGVEPTAKVLAVADGIGGHHHGAIASRLALETLRGSLAGELAPSGDAAGLNEAEIAEGLRRCLNRCEGAIRAAGARDPRLLGMGTTLTIAYVRWPELHLLHVGDSRAYLWHRAVLSQLTRDHTLAQQMVDSGNMDAERAASSGFAHMLSNALGGDELRAVGETRAIQLELGDALLLCTDGLTGELSDERIAEELGDGAAARRTCGRLVGLANAAGGKDNVTAVVARFDAAGAGQWSPDQRKQR